MPMTYQVSVFLENKPGHFEKVTGILKKVNINIRTMTLSNTASGWGILNLVVDDPERAHSELCANGLSAALREIFILKMHDKAGGLDDILKRLFEAGINFDNAYGRVVSEGETAYLVIDVENTDDAREKLSRIGIHPLSAAETYAFNRIKNK